MNRREWFSIRKLSRAIAKKDLSLIYIQTITFSNKSEEIRANCPDFFIFSADIRHLHKNAFFCKSVPD